MSVELKFADGWTQEITAGNERNDLLSYISDTHKSVYGFRPRGYVAMSWSMDDLRAEAAKLEAEVNASIERAREERARQAADEAAHHLAYAQALKPKPVNNRPFANLNVLLAEQTSYYDF